MDGRGWINSRVGLGGLERGREGGWVREWVRGLEGKRVDERVG